MNASNASNASNAPRPWRALTGAVVAVSITAALLGLGATTVVTDAAFTDTADVHLGESPGSGIGVKQNFDLALIGRDGTMAEGTAGAPASLAIDPVVAAGLAPGRTIETTVVAFNNTPRWRAGVGVTVSSATTSAMLGHLRFTAVDTATGDVLFGDPAAPDGGVALADASGALARTLSGSGRVPLVPGQAAAAIPAEARAGIRLIVAYLDDLSPAEQRSLNGATVPLTVTVGAEKV